MTSKTESKLVQNPNTTTTTGKITREEALSLFRHARPGDRILSLGYIMQGGVLPTSKTPDTATPSDDLIALPKDKRGE